MIRRARAKPREAAKRRVSRISSKGQITLPKAVREALGAVPGDLVSYEVEGNVVQITRLEPFDAAFHAALSQTMHEWASEQDDEAFRDL